MHVELKIRLSSAYWLLFMDLLPFDLLVVPNFKGIVLISGRRYFY